jgi:arginyl-tRNA synthetase
MSIMFDPIKKSISEAISQKITNNFSAQDLTVEKIYDLITLAPNLKMGHLAFPCFPLAKSLKKAPPMIANELAENFKAQGYIKEVKAIGPYLNFFLNPKAVAEYLFSAIENGEYFKTKLKSSAEKAMIEYFQPNTHKEVHVGHLRNLCLGETVVNLHRYAGHETIACTYPGDSGTHVAKVVWYLHEMKPEQPSTDLANWLGEIYSKANAVLEEQRGTDKEEENRIKLTEILKQIHDESGEYYETWLKTREWSIEHMKEICSWAGVEFERWYFESQVDAPSMQYAQKLYEQGKLTKDDGAIGMDLSEDKLGFCILIKSDGNGLYATKDVELARKKFEEFDVKRSIYVVDQRQSFHFKQVFKTLEHIGFDQAKDCYHLAYEFVELPDGALSSRKGNIVSGMDLINSMQETVKNEFLKKYEDWDQKQKDLVAKQVAMGAIKYAMLCVDNNKKIVFDMKEWLKMDGESGPYIQYAHARIKSLVEKAAVNDLSTADFAKLTHEAELELMLQLLQFNQLVLNACDKYQTSMLTSYLYDTSKVFNKFYAQCSVSQAETEELKYARLALCQASAKVLEKGLELLGIPAPSRM